MKTGAKQKHYVASDGQTIVGLSRQTDLRWRIIGTAIRFTEPDEKRAIEKFHRMTRPHIVGSVGVSGLPVKISHQRAQEIADQMDISKDDLVDLLTTDEQRYW